MGLGFKRKASEEVATPESGQQASKKARTDSPEKEVSGLDP
jgi:histone acetyltransferase